MLHLLCVQGVCYPPATCEVGGDSGQRPTSYVFCVCCAAVTTTCYRAVDSHVMKAWEETPAGSSTSGSSTSLLPAEASASGEEYDVDEHPNPNIPRWNHLEAPADNADLPGTPDTDAKSALGQLNMPLSPDAWNNHGKEKMSNAEAVMAAKVIHKWTTNMNNNQEKSLLGRVFTAVRDHLMKGRLGCQLDACAKPTMYTPDGKRIIQVGSMVMLARPSNFENSFDMSAKSVAKMAADEGPGGLGCFKRELNGCAGVNCMVLHPAGDRLVTGGSTKAAGTRSLSSAETGWVQVWKMEPGSQAWSLMTTMTGT